jgi:hypothetical protein
VPNIVVLVQDESKNRNQLTAKVRGQKSIERPKSKVHAHKAPNLILADTRDWARLAWPAHSHPSTEDRHEESIRWLFQRRNQSTFRDR